MYIHEYQAKQILRENGIPSPPGMSMSESTRRNGCFLTISKASSMSTHRDFARSDRAR